MMNNRPFVAYCFTTVVLFITTFFPVFGISLGGTVETSVVDEAGILSDSYETGLRDQIIALHQETTAQVAIVTVLSLEGRDIFDVGLDLARYGTNDSDQIENADNNEFIGDSRFNNGIVIVIAPEERKRNIQVGDGLEGKIPDAAAKRMGQQILVPAFRQESYGEGLNDLLRVISSEIREEASERNLNENVEEKTSLMDLLIIFFLIIIFFGPLLQQRLKTDNDKYYGSGVGTSIFTLLGGLFVGWSALWLVVPLFFSWLLALHMKPGSGSGGGSFSGGGFSGGGGGSFSSWGGGSFSGGGASGSW